MTSSATSAQAPATTGSWPSAASIFNGFILAQVVFGLWELGLVDQLRATGRVDRGQLDAGGPDAAPLLAPLVAAGLLAADEGGWQLTPAGGQVLDEIGFLVWAVGGCGELFHRAGALAAGRLAYGRDVRRDEGLVAVGSALAARTHVMPYVLGMVQQLYAERPVRRVVDVGCGTAGFLVELCRRDPGLAATGIDVSPAACELARTNAHEAGLGDRIDIVCASFQSMMDPGQGAAVWPGTDLVTSFFMVHDLMGDPARAARDLRALRDQLPAHARLLVADTAAYQPGDQPPPIFSLGFQLAHELMGVRLRSTGEYEALFAAAGLAVARRLATGAPSTWLYLLR